MFQEFDGLMDAIFKDYPEEARNMLREQHTSGLVIGAVQSMLKLIDPLNADPQQLSIAFDMLRGYIEEYEKTNNA